MHLPDFRNRHGERLDTTFHPGRRTGVLVLLGHGVTGNKDRPLLVAVAEGLAARGWPCLRLSFSGNGASGGDFAAATIPKEHADLHGLLGSLPAGVAVAYAGHSMGGAVGVRAAATPDPRLRVLVTLAGMIHTGAFCDREFGTVTPGHGCMWDEPECPLSPAFVAAMQDPPDLLETAARVRLPWLLVHGTADDLVPVDDSRAAHAVAPGPKRLVEIEDAGHSFDESTWPLVVEAIDDWLDAHLAG